MAFELDTVIEFKRRLLELSREELLELIELQDPKYIPQIQRIEWVFANKLKHLYWDDGTPVEGLQLTNEQLASLIDPPFIFDRKLAKEFGFTEDQQRQIHIASDPVLWSKEFLGGKKPRVYQVLVLRDPNINKVLRWGRRMGKSFVMALYLLWYAYVHNNAKCIVLAPMKNQVGVIYDAILERADENAIVKDSIERSVRSPQYEINFTNGSSIKLFTTGMKSGAKADGVRGQEAHVLVLDEMDYMGSEDLIAILPMLQKTDENQEDKVLLAASTPSGRREMFWNWNHDPDFSAFWFPTYVNPLWSQKDEDRLRSSTTEMGFRHEYEADWGEDAQGVYPKQYLDMAFVEPGWEYKPRVENMGTFFVFGVDWDKYAADGGVNIVVLECFPQTHHDESMAGKIRLAYREELMRDEYLLTKAVNRIIELNAVFMPRHIYIDKGYGEMQSETLILYGKENPSTRLHKVVKSWAFNETIEVPDPYTHIMSKKDLKPFMVENVRLLLEKQEIIFSDHDEDLYSQLLSYIVVRTSIAGRPTFGTSSGPDHAHDALLLAAFAVTYNYDSLINLDYAQKSISISNEVFLPMFDAVSNKDWDVVEEAWGDAPAPVYNRRKMSHTEGRSLMGSRSRPIRRKMF